MAFQVERSMKDAEEVDVSIGPALIDDPVAAVQQDSDTGDFSGWWRWPMSGKVRGRYAFS